MHVKIADEDELHHQVADHPDVETLPSVVNLMSIDLCEDDVDDGTAVPLNVWSKAADVDSPSNSRTRSRDCSVSKAWKVSVTT